MKVCIAIPAPDLVYPDFSLQNLPEIIAYTKSKRPNIELFVRMNNNAVRTDLNRNVILKEIIDEFDYVLWLDADQVYPPDIIVKFLENPVDVVGCLYHKRSEPYDPVCYYSGKEVGKYVAVDPRQLPKDQLVEVDGLGFGGMMVNMNVYRSLGEEKWMVYGSNFHIPESKGDQNSHDLVFCQKAKQIGKKIFVHTGVKAGHIGLQLVTQKTWEDYHQLNDRSVTCIKKLPKIAVLLPSLDLERAYKTIAQLKSRDGINREEVEVEYWAIEDMDRAGYVSVINNAIQNIAADFYVYTAEDAFAGRNWLSVAYECLRKSKKQLFAFNDGKWHGTLASFGMMTNEFARKFWHTQYHSHYIDTEITLRAIALDSLAYDPDSVLVEVDYNKKGVNADDKRLFNLRKKSLFSLRPDLQEMFS